MKLDRLPRKLVEKITALTEDEEFQKLFDADKVLNDLDEEYLIAREAYKDLWEKRDQRICQLVVDYLIDTKQIRSFQLLKLKNVVREALISRMREQAEDVHEGEVL